MIISNYIAKLGLKNRYINHEIQKINSFTFETLEIIIANLKLNDKQR